VAWKINGQIGPHARPGTDVHGWLWELERDGNARRVLVELAGTVWAIHERGGPLPSEVREAIASQGRNQVERVAAIDDPPRVISCTTNGCVDRPPDKPGT